MDPVVATLAILVLAVVAFVSGKVQLAVVALGVALSLFLAGVLTLPEALAGFGDPTVLFIASLFVVSEALDASGVTAWVGQKVIGRKSMSRARLTLIVSLLVAVVAAFISINGAVAALLPVVVVVVVKAKLVASKLLMPLAFAASAGSLLTLTGTPVNPLVSDAAVAAGGRAFGFFEYALVGVPLVVVSVAFMATFGGRLLPDRAADRFGETPADASQQAADLRRSYDVTLDTGSFFTVEDGVVEVLIPPRSTLIGRQVCAGMTTRDENLVILAVKRGVDRADERSGSGATERALSPRGYTIQPGDSVLVQGPWASLERYSKSSDVMAVTSPQALRRSVPLGRGAKRALIILGLMVLLLATGVVPPAVAGLLAAGAIVVTRVLTVPETFRSIQWTTVILIAGMIPLSTAVIKTGAADILASGLLSFVGPGSPTLALLALCAVALVLGQLISNTATVLVVIPVAASVAAVLDVSAQPFMMALTVVGAAAFLTPIATPVNLMVMQPGGYRFGDYWRLGLPLALIFLAFAVFYVPLIWHF